MIAEWEAMKWNQKSQCVQNNVITPPAGHTQPNLYL